jgi:hypothetical protein
VRERGSEGVRGRWVGTNCGYYQDGRGLEMKEGKEGGREQGSKGGIQSARKVGAIRRKQPGDKFSSSACS